MRILFAANEAFPLYKLGGLGDVIGSLPKYLASDELDVRLVLPYHPEIQVETTQVACFSVTYDHRKLPVSIHQTFLPGSSLPVYLVHNQLYLSSSTDASDNHADKYAFFSLAVASWINLHSSWQPQIFHLHDWHVALIPVILTHLFHQTRYRYILTIHNLAYQANTTTRVDKRLGLPDDACSIIPWDNQDHSLNLLMQGILHSDRITTVSPTYAQEILTPQFSFGLDEVLKAKSPQITGILNGLDYQTFNPSIDPSLEQKYNSANAITHKKYYQMMLAQQLKLKRTDDSKLISFIGRVDPAQKGIEILIDSIDQHLLPPSPHIFVFLGVGDRELEARLHQVSQNRSNIAIITRFDETLARKLYAASDLTLIPSHFEPCGLVQMISMSYGSLPIAHQVGGLGDTITHDVNGFLYSPNNTLELNHTIAHALQLISSPTKQQEMISTAMKTKFYYSQAAKEYQKLYTQILLA